MKKFTKISVLIILIASSFSNKAMEVKAKLDWIPTILSLEVKVGSFVVAAEAVRCASNLITQIALKDQNIIYVSGWTKDLDPLLSSYAKQKRWEEGRNLVASALFAGGVIGVHYIFGTTPQTLFKNWAKGNKWFLLAVGTLSTSYTAYQGFQYINSNTEKEWGKKFNRFYHPVSNEPLTLEDQREKDKFEAYNKVTTFASLPNSKNYVLYKQQELRASILKWGIRSFLLSEVTLASFH